MKKLVSLTAAVLFSAAVLLVFSCEDVLDIAVESRLDERVLAESDLYNHRPRKICLPCPPAEIPAPDKPLPAVPEMPRVRR